MVISDKYRYVFVELPRTGSTAIRKVLLERYEGRPVLYKHATYEEFLKTCSEEQKRYFVFSGIRNPIDDAVSLYFKLKTNHKNKFHSGSRRQSVLRSLVQRLSGRTGSSDEMSFQQFFLKNYKQPYDQWSSLSHRKFDFLIRFENLADDFAQIVGRLGMPSLDQFPVKNRTSSRSRNFAAYYTPRAVQRAGEVFGPYMQEWGYEFPAAWGDIEISSTTRIKFRTLRMARLFYWKLVRPVLHQKELSAKHRRLNSPAK